MISRSVQQLKQFFSKGTIFDKILSKQIPSKTIYEDNDVYAFQDIQPQAPFHILIIPKIKDNLTGISQAEQKNINLLGKLLLTASKIAKQNNLSGYRLVIN